jgi:hypothetical protein
MLRVHRDIASPVDGKTVGLPRTGQIRWHARMFESNLGPRRETRLLPEGEEGANLGALRIVSIPK